MDMRGFMTIKTIEETAIRAWNIRNRWNDIRLGKFQEEREDVAIVYLIWVLVGALCRGGDSLQLCLYRCGT